MKSRTENNNNDTEEQREREGEALKFHDSLIQFFMRSSYLASSCFTQDSLVGSQNALFLN